ncbi:accessory Sec system translocase SecA2 [Leifsonia aquatica]|uniref:accessory Sec system translocase SecA2 n=1 Tax=Leifsonia aquatica TaxID=144185 RepID=UPI00382B2CC5
MTTDDARPRGIGRVLGMPGTRSFARFDRRVDSVLAAQARLSALSSAELLERASQLVGLETDGWGDERLGMVAEAVRRAFGYLPHREQLVGAQALGSGHAVEMDTGEGKTLTGAMAAAILAMQHRTVHVLSINDYLARRDAEWMSGMFSALGVSVGFITQRSSHDERVAAYRQQVTYASVSEIGYDVLRDRFCIAAGERCSPRFDVAIVDEADAVMIDEAMSPLVLAGAGEGLSTRGRRMAEIVESLDPGAHYLVDADEANASFTEDGLDRVEEALGGVDLYSGQHTSLLIEANLALHALALVHPGVDYLVEDGVLRLISASRGRVTDLQRWPDGLQCAVEAKEGLTQTAQGMILDTVTIQDLLHGYSTLAAMSGTIVQVADELLEFYGLESGRVERHHALNRTEHPDRAYATREELLTAVIDEVDGAHRLGRPVLVGTQSVAESEALAERLGVRGLNARVLNARNDEAEANVIGKAGEHGAITISTQMSGRGTDIVLGGTDGRDRDRVLTTGGLAVVGVGHYPSRRLDLQLRGRSGRQGDPGSSVILSSLEDELVRTNAPDSIRTARPGAAAKLSDRRRLSIVRSAQRIAESRRLDGHRATWEYSRAISRQREFVLAHRSLVASTGISLDEVRSRIPDDVDRLINETSADTVASAVRVITLRTGDRSWSQHLAVLQEIRDGIHLRALAGDNPADAFHLIALREFDGWVDRIYAAVSESLTALTGSGLAGAVESAEQRHPSVTWTYMVSDNPLGDPISRIRHRRGRTR